MSAGPPTKTGRAGTPWLGRHWLLMCNGLNGLTIVGAALAPWLRAQGREPLATLVYLAYRPRCLQRPSHSFFLFRHQLALEHRMLALALGLLIGGLLFAPLRRHLRPLNWRLLVLLHLPMLIDFLSQTVGLRDSTWQWRVAPACSAVSPLCGGPTRISRAALPRHRCRARPSRPVRHRRSKRARSSCARR